MNIQPLINAIRYKLRYGITVEWYNFWYMALRCHQKITPQVASIDETIRIIVEDQCSVSRFGDGEMLLTNPDKEIGFQKGNVLLAQRLKEVLTSHEEGHLVCISDTFENIYRYNRKARRFWRTHFFLYGSWWDRLLLPDRLYYNTFITRPYICLLYTSGPKPLSNNARRSSCRSAAVKMPSRGISSACSMAIRRLSIPYLTRCSLASLQPGP